VTRTLLAIVGVLVVVFVVVFVVALAGRSHGHGGRGHRTSAPAVAAG
jgi:hypothetical protein